MTAWRFLFFSIVAHILLWVLVEKSAELAKKMKDSGPIEISIMDKNEKSQIKKGEVVPSLPQLQRPNIKPPPTSFSSEHDQFVEKQTHARNLKFYNPISPSIMGSDQNEVKEKESPQTKSENDSQTGALSFAKRNKEMNKSNSSTASDPLLYENTDVGSITALNANGMQFYAFTSRIKGPMVNRWTNNLRYFESRWNRRDIERLANHDWQTVVEVVLDKDGHHLKTYLLQSSGEKEVDAASYSIFEQIGYFPNPPKEMVGEDGTIHLKFGFTFQVPPLRQMASP